MNVKKLPHDTDFQTRAVDIHTLLISIHIYRNNLMAAFKYQLHNNFGVFLRQNSCSLNYWDPFRKLKRKLYDFSSQVGRTRSSFWVIYRNIFQFASICWHPDAKTSALRSLLTHLHICTWGWGNATKCSWKYEFQNTWAFLFSTPILLSYKF